MCYGQASICWGI
ncbi:unnamed protein product [Debaryomyces tyrocola]|nr:unnamed protein product [Debaryomyces tyrocola]